MKITKLGASAPQQPCSVEDFDALLPAFKRAAINVLLNSQDRKINSQNKLIHKLIRENEGLSIALAFLKGYTKPLPISANPTPSGKKVTR